MAISGAIPITFRAYGVCDALDGSNAPPGAMAALTNLIPSTRTRQQFVPRPASVQATNFSGFTTPGKVNALLVVGTRAYGMVASDRYAGKDEPFCYDLVGAAFVTIGNVTSANCPTTPSASGEWEPPTMAMVGKRILITHPGYPGSGTKFGWIDMRAFTSTTLTATTSIGSAVLTVVSANPITAGVAVGDAITGAGIPAGTYIVSMAAATITMSQNATANAAGVALSIAAGTRAAPIYGAGDTNESNLTERPVAVSQFNGRAYFAVANSLEYTDSLKPWNRAASTQALTLGDEQAVTALGGVPLSSQVVGGIVQSLIAFKADATYFQVTGDPATSDLKLEQVSGAVGTLGPLTVVPTPRGLAYIAPDGLRIIDPVTGRADQIVGANGEGVTTPFLYAVSPSRMCAAFNQNIYRVSVQNGAIDGQPVQEWWFHFSLGIWTGPHDFPAALISAYHDGDNDFILAASGIDAKLWESTVSPSASSTYTENSVAMNFTWTTGLLPDNDSGVANQIIESSLGLTLPATQTMTIQAFDDGENTLDTVTMAGDGGTAAIWNAFTWGAATWGGGVTPFRQFTLNWTAPLVFKQASVSVYGPCVSGFTIGNLIAKYQPLGYQGAYL